SVRHIGRAPRLFANAVELLRGDPIARRHPRTAAGDDTLECEIARDVRGVDPARRHEVHVAVWRRHRLQKRETTARFRGKELHGGESLLERCFQLCGRADAWIYGNVERPAVVDDAWIEPRRHHELRAGIASELRLFRSQNGSGAREHVGRLGGYAT